MNNNTKQIHRTVWEMAWPMILANISTPLLGLVDTAVMGYQDTAKYLGAIALGGLLFSFIFWSFGFLRMSTTGLTAQAFGKNIDSEIISVLIRSLGLALIISMLLILLNKPIAWVGLFLLKGNHDTELLTATYFSIRIWSAPATLSLYALSGWFIGIQNVRAPLFIVITTNCCNIILDLLFVVHWNLAIQGVAWATLISEYIGLIVAVYFSFRTIVKLPKENQVGDLLNRQSLKKMLAINTDIFIRTLCLIFAFAFFTNRSAILGEIILAANSILLQFQSLMAYVLDAFAHASEALVGRAKGNKNQALLKQSIKITGIWTLVAACIFSLLYFCIGNQLIAMLTNIDNVKKTASIYLPWAVVLPLVSWLCFLLDGVFIGATLAKEMRNSMILSLFVIYFPVWYLTQLQGNHGLWFSFFSFMLARGLSMGWILKKKFNQKAIKV